MLAVMSCPLEGEGCHEVTERGLFQTFTGQFWVLNTKYMTIVSNILILKRETGYNMDQ